ncbi:MAG: hypothetical protein KZQ99_19845 [Candidatus Thiodiazotropha sp. (ex Dulcina madagascariensis)]|nr:hypothetical protein [Candidatus Thiodiazotropha sp. (ex Dulcina madagascariensis)]
MRDSKLFRGFVIFLLGASIFILVNYSDADTSLMKYLWPMHILIIFSFIIILLGMNKDKIEIENAVKIMVGGDTWQKKVKGFLISNIIFLLYLLLTLSPAPLIVKFGIIDSSDVRVHVESIKPFTHAWFVFSLVIFFNTLILSGPLKKQVIKLLSKWSK